MTGESCVAWPVGGTDCTMRRRGGFLSSKNTSMSFLDDCAHRQACAAEAGDPFARQVAKSTLVPI